MWASTHRRAKQLDQHVITEDDWRDTPVFYTNPSIIKIAPLSLRGICSMLNGGREVTAPSNYRWNRHSFRQREQKQRQFARDTNLQLLGGNKEGGEATSPLVKGEKSIKKTPFYQLYFSLLVGCNRQNVQKRTNVIWFYFVGGKKLLLCLRCSLDGVVRRPTENSDRTRETQSDNLQRVWRCTVTFSSTRTQSPCHACKSNTINLQACWQIFTSNAEGHWAIIRVSLTINQVKQKLLGFFLLH